MGETLAFEQRRRDCTPVAVGVVTYAFAPMPTMLASEKMARFESSVNLACRGKADHTDGQVVGGWLGTNGRRREGRSGLCR